MNYTLITARGRIMSFYVPATARLYRSLYGGTLVSAQTLREEVNLKTQQNMKEVVTL